MLQLVAALPLCFVIVSGGENGNVQQKLLHEQAHCWGWVHADRASTFGEAYEPPARYLKKYPNMKVRRLSPAAARGACKQLINWPSFACMKGGLFPE